MKTINTPEELMAAAWSLVPALQSRASLAEELRRVPDENIRETIETGLLDVLRPKKYGGPELGYKDSVQVCTILAQGCTNTAWCVFVYLTHMWLIAMLEEAGQEEIFNSPDPVLACGIFNSAMAKAEIVPGGYMLSGRWTFGSGGYHSTWGALAAKVTLADGTIEDRLFVVRREEYHVLDTWQSSGLRGTGSGEVTAQNVFVPAARTLSFDQFDGSAPGAKLHESIAYRMPVIESFALPGVLLAIGASKGAITAYEKRLATRVRAFTDEKQVDDIQAQVRLSEAVMHTNSAELMANAMLEEFENDIRAGRKPSDEALLRSRMVSGYCTRLARQAVTILAEACGASALMADGVIGRAVRDITVICSHHAIDYDGGTIKYARARLGLPVSVH